MRRLDLVNEIHRSHRENLLSKNLAITYPTYFYFGETFDEVACAGVRRARYRHLGR